MVQAGPLRGVAEIKGRSRRETQALGTGGLPNHRRARYDTAKRRKAHRLVLNVRFTANRGKV